MGRNVHWPHRIDPTYRTQATLHRPDTAVAAWHHLPRRHCAAERVELLLLESLLEAVFHSRRESATLAPASGLTAIGTAGLTLRGRATT